MNPLLDAAAAVQVCCESHGWGFCFIGGLAVLRWGDPRVTRDVDVTVLAGFGDETPVVDALLDRFAARVDDPRGFAIANRVVLLSSDDGTPVDVSLGAIPYEERAVSRATAHDLGSGTALLTCSAEDLIVMKAFAGRDQDWLDVRGVIARTGSDLDTDLVMTEAADLLALKDEPATIVRLRRLLDEAG